MTKIFNSFKTFICIFALVDFCSVMTGCEVRAYKYNSDCDGYDLDCGGKIILYSDGTFEVTGCSYFSCSRDKGRWKEVSGGYIFSTKDGEYLGTGDKCGDVISIMIPN